METITRDGKIIILRMRETGSEIIELFRLETVGGTIKKISNGETQDSYPAFSPSFIQMAYAGSFPQKKYGNVYIYSNIRTQLTHFKDMIIKDVTFSPYGNYVYFSGQQEKDTLYANYLMRYVLATKSIDTLFTYSSTIPKSCIENFVWSDTKQRLAFTAGQPNSEESHIYTIETTGYNRYQISTVPARYVLKGYDGIDIYFNYKNDTDVGIYKIDVGGQHEIIPLIDCTTCDKIIWDFKSEYK